MRASIAAAMLKSWREQPQFALTRHGDMSHGAQLRRAKIAPEPAGSGVPRQPARLRRATSYQSRSLRW